MYGPVSSVSSYVKWRTGQSEIRPCIQCKFLCQVAYTAVKNNVSCFLFYAAISQSPQNLTKLHKSVAKDTVISTRIFIKTSLVRWLRASLFMYFPQECRR